MNQVEIYKAEKGQTQIDVKFEDNTVWLTQKQLAELFEKNIMTGKKQTGHTVRALVIT